MPKLNKKYYRIIHYFDIKIDGTTGDGTEIGKCPSSFTNYRCLSTGECNVCRLISGYAEGCDITSTTPVCDADSSTSATEDSAVAKVAQCVKCRKNGTKNNSIICPINCLKFVIK